MPADKSFPTIRAVLFDFDGTLTRPEALDFPALKQALGCPLSQPVLEFIASLPSLEKQQEALRILHKFESDAAAASQPNSYAEELVAYLNSRNLTMGIISRNSLCSIRRALKNFKSVRVSDFEIIVSRDDAVEPKPDPAGIVLAAEKMGVQVGEMLVVGDFVFDIDAGQKAGAPTVLLTNGTVGPALVPPPDYVVMDLSEVKNIVQFLAPLPAGKLPNHLLGQFLEERPLDDDSVLVRPGVGEDVAVVQLEGQDGLIVLKSDPITFATDRVGYYTVLINANDVATSGAVPRWLLSTLLFPVGSNAAQIRALIEELQEISRHFGMSLCGGHTEITDAVKKPVAVGQLIGTVARNDLIDKRRMAEGNCILLTKSIALEGTSIIAREFPLKLRGLGLSEDEIEKCRQLLVSPGISILEEARIAARSRMVTAMHDVTEGGLATAVEELSVAGQHRIRIYMDQISVLPETRQICELLGLDPMGLIGSGSLLIVCQNDACERVMTAIQESGIQVSRIGEVLGKGFGIEAVRNEGEGVAWPHFDVDELTRV